MKFSQLQVGQRFEFEGTVFRKATPLLASEEAGSAQRMIPRSAVVRPLDGAAPPPPAPPERLLPLAQVTAQLEAWHAECLNLLAPDDSAGRERQEQARARLLQRLTAL